jgi:hypothetical protein
LLAVVAIRRHREIVPFRVKIFCMLEVLIDYDQLLFRGTEKLIQGFT